MLFVLFFKCHRLVKHENIIFNACIDYVLFLRARKKKEVVVICYVFTFFTQMNFTQRISKNKRSGILR